MGSEMGILAANGRPFSDLDAARIKARTLTDELGETYDVFPVEGGYTIRRNAEPASPSTEPVRPATAGEGEADENPFTIPSTGVVDLVSARRIPQGRPQTNATQNEKPVRPHDTADANFGGLPTIELRPAWRSFWKYHIPAVIGFLVAMFPTAFLLAVLRVDPSHVLFMAEHGILPLVRLAGLMAGLVGLNYSVYGRFANQYTVKPELLESSRGIFARKAVRVEFAHIRSIDLTQGLIDRLLNIGTVEVSTAATADAEVIFEGVPDPVALKDEISRRRSLGRVARKNDEDE